MLSATLVYACTELVKTRTAGGQAAGAAADTQAAFQLRVPELHIHAGEVILLRGESGCGKSTLLDLLALALRPDRAKAFSFRPDAGARRGAGPDLMVLWQRADLDALGRLRGTYIGYVPQTGGLLSFLSVRDNIALPARLFGAEAGPDLMRRLETLAERLGLRGHLHKMPSALSVGERQRVAIARALMHRPRVLLADEPTASVDPMNARIILGLMLDLVRDTGVTAVIASHDQRTGQLDGMRTLQHRLEQAADMTVSVFED